MGHFYYTDPDSGLAQPLYEVPYADPRKGMRAATIGDARKLNGLPSPNTIMGIKAKPGVQWWSDDLLIDSVVEHISGNADWMAGELDRAAIRDLHKAKREAAANEGTAIHDEIEHAVLLWLGRIDDYTTNPEVDPRIRDTAMEWLWSKVEDDNWIVEDVEAIFSNSRVGYGGKIDLTATKNHGPAAFIIVDWKSTNTKGKPFKTYPLDKTPLLAAYAMGYYGSLEDVECWNVFLSRDEPGLILPVLYSPEEIRDGWEEFQRCFASWIRENKYDPREV